WTSRAAWRSPTRPAADCGCSTRSVESWSSRAGSRAHARWPSLPMERCSSPKGIPPRCGASSCPRPTSPEMRAVSRITTVACLAAAPWVAAWAGEVEDPSCGDLVVVQRSDQVIYPLPRKLLSANGDSVWSRVRPWIRDQDYGLERTRGVLRLRVPPVPGETLWVHVCGLVDPPALSAQYAAYRPARAAAADSASADSLELITMRPGIARST